MSSRFLAGMLCLALSPPAPAKEPVRTDLHGDPLPPGAIARLGTVRWRHVDRVRAGVFSADGAVLVTHCSSSQLWLWETSSGRLIRTFCEPEEITAFAPAPDGRSLAYVAGAHLRVCASRTGRLLWQSPKVAAGGWPREQVRSLAFSPDGKSVASAGDDDVIRLWDAATGREQRRLTGHQDSIRQVAFSPDGRTLASASFDGSVRLWDVTNGQEVRTLPHDRPCVSVAFAPDGKALAWGDDAGGAHLASVKTGRPLCHVATGDEHAVKQVYFSSDGGLLATHVETLCFWDAATGRRVNALRDADTAPGAVSPDGKTVALWGRDQSVHLWDLRQGRERPSPPGHTDAVLRAVYLGAGDRIASVAEDETIRLWETATGRLLHCRKGQESWELTVSPDGARFATFGHDGRIRVWDSVTGRPLWRSPDFATFSALLSYHPDGRALVCADGLRVKWLHPATGAVLRGFTMPFSIDPASTLLLSSCGRWMVVQEINSRRVQVCDAETGEARPMPAGFERCIRALALSPDGRYLVVAQKDATGERENVLLWEMSAGAVRQLMTTRGKHCFAAAFTPDGKTLATARRDGRVRLWSTVTGEAVGDLGEPDVGEPGVERMVFSPDGGLMATWGDDTTVLIWDVAALTRRDDLARLPRASAAEAWAKLAGPADAAHTAIWQLVADPQRSVPFLAERLRPVAAPPREQVARWIADLDSDDFAARERAAAELEKGADTIREPLVAALNAAPSAEARRRLKSLVEAARQTAPPSGELRRSLRAVEALEHVGSPEARRVLEKLAAGADGAALTRDARAALARLRDRAARAGSR